MNGIIDSLEDMAGLLRRALLRWEFLSCVDFGCLHFVGWDSVLNSDDLFVITRNVIAR